MPGAGHVLIGEWLRGLMILLPWGTILGLLYWARERVIGVENASLDDYIAFATLIALLFFLWVSALWDLTVRRSRPPSGKGDSQWTIAARQFRRNKPALVGMGVILILYIVVNLAVDVIYAYVDPRIEYS